MRKYSVRLLNEIPIFVVADYFEIRQGILFFFKEESNLVASFSSGVWLWVTEKEDKGSLHYEESDE